MLGPKTSDHSVKKKTTISNTKVTGILKTARIFHNNIKKEKESFTKSPEELKQHKEPIES